uniref:Uncharacterized protein n=1 Tax=Steinernema glaseri TaxID=37863 RepID=A0A1I7YIF3_9BILA
MENSQPVIAFKWQPYAVMPHFLSSQRMSVVFGCARGTSQHPRHAPQTSGSNERTSLHKRIARRRKIACLTQEGLTPLCI